jgi:hypothetical protein
MASSRRLVIIVVIGFDRLGEASVEALFVGQPVDPAGQVPDCEHHLAALAKEMRGLRDRAAELGLSEKELAFYDAVCQNDAAVLELGDDVLKAIARELVEVVRRSATIDWNLKESARAGLRAKVRRLVARYDYPPDMSRPGSARRRGRWLTALSIFAARRPVATVERHAARAAIVGGSR